MKRIIGIFLCLAGLCGCASSPVLGSLDPLFADARFEPPAEAVHSDSVFAFSPAMQGYYDTRIAQQVRHLGPHRGLFEALHGELKLDFDTTMTRTAAQAFEARSGNCMSLVILTAAFARKLDLSFSYQEVYGVDTWSRAGGLAILSGHVNLTLAPRRHNRLVRNGIEDTLTIDFLPPGARSPRSTRAITEERVLAMYHNNRAAEAMSAGDLDAAYWQARHAIRTDPGFLPALNTLGVIYLRHGDLAQSEQVLALALEREPANPQVLANLSRVLADQGRAGEANALRERLAQLSSYPPFHFYQLGVAALERGNSGEALDWFDRELSRIPYDDELHFATALANLQHGEVRRARRHLVLAIRNSTTRDSRQLYAAKLEYLEKQIH